MDQGKLIKMLMTETRSIVDQYVSDPGIDTSEKYRAIVSQILHLATEEERFDILYSIVKDKYPTMIKEIQGM